jgi:alpha,alpha-trehalase
MTSRRTQWSDLVKLDAVIFDMDGVITNTAGFHASAWKRLFDEYLEKRARREGEKFRPFDKEREYREYVDGKPRYDGVRDFLRSRGIGLPYGEPSDGPDRETICGLGNRKNRYFLERLRRDGARPYLPAVELIRKLRKSSVKTAVFSASRNAGEVLRVAGVSRLFDARVDGQDAAELGLEGKPAPDMLIEAARRVGAAPDRTAVVEDALAGVEAGRRGGFSLVVGVDRGDSEDTLRSKGANVVVKHLSELLPSEEDDRATNGTPADDGLPSALDNQEEIRRVVRERHLAVFLDYDGTLTPIVSDPAEAKLSDEMRKVLVDLASKCRLAIISGRDLEDVRRMVGVDGIAYAGSHGFDVSLPGQRRRDTAERSRFKKALDDAEGELREGLTGVTGVRLERKAFGLAVHYRNVDKDRVDDVLRVFEEVLGRYPDLKRSTGKKVVELLPNADWDKGKALNMLCKSMGLRADKTAPLYIGDDDTDEDAFRVVRGSGIPIVVGMERRNTAAEYVLADPEQVRVFLRDLSSWLGRRTT